MGKGSEYVVIDVPNGVSRVELNGTSLAIHANAEYIIAMIEKRVRSQAIKARMIKILAYYQG